MTVELDRQHVLTRRVATQCLHRRTFLGELDVLTLGLRDTPAALGLPRCFRVETASDEELSGAVSERLPDIAWP
jgi:hypothetical protein